MADERVLLQADMRVVLKVDERVVVKAGSTVGETAGPWAWWMAGERADLMVVHWDAESAETKVTTLVASMVASSAVWTADMMASETDS